MTRPVAEVQSSVDVPVDQLRGDRADELFGQLGRCVEPAPAAVVDLARGIPTVRNADGAPASLGLVREHRAEHAQRCIGHRTAEGPPSHAALHRGEVEVLDDDLAIGGGQLRAELVPCLAAQVYGSAVHGSEFGFRSSMTA
jgi:hypothetical protein